MGKGDRRSRKGKIWKHSYGITRKRKKHKKPAFVPKVKKEKKIAKPVEEKLIIPQIETVTAPREEKIYTKPETITSNEVVPVKAGEPVAAVAEKEEVKKVAKAKKSTADKKEKPATEKKAPAVKKEAVEKEKKPAAPKKKPAKKK